MPTTLYQADSAKTLEKNLQRLKDNDPTLTQLTLTAFPAKDAALLADALQKNTSLKSLVIEGNISEELDEKTLKIVADILRKNQLTSLSLFRKVSKEGLLVLSDVLKTSPALTELDISAAQFDKGTFATFTKALEHNTTLTSLNLSLNNLTDEHVPSLELLLLKNNTLSSLDIGDNHITTAGASVLATALVDNNKLRKFEMRGNQLGELEDVVLGRFNRLIERNNHVRSPSFLLQSDSPISAKPAATSASSVPPSAVAPSPRSNSPTKR